MNTPFGKCALRPQGLLLGLLLSLVLVPAWADGLVTNSTGGSEQPVTGNDGGSNPHADPEQKVPPVPAKKPKMPTGDGSPCPPHADDSGNGADPVSLYDGRLSYADSDMVVNGLFPIEVTRRYDSRSTYDSTLGYGWSFNFDRRLYQYPDGSVVIRYACGARDRFVYTGGAYVTPAGAREGDLVENPDGSFVYARQYGTKEFYDAQGRLTAVQNRYGHRHEYSYDAAGKLPITGTSPYAVDPATPMTVAYAYHLTRIDERAADGVLTGNHVAFAYDATTGRLTSVTASDGRTVSYVHDATAGLTAGNLVQVNGLEGIVTTYQYQDSNDTHNLTSIQEEAGATPWVSTYDSQDRVTQQTHGNDLYTVDYTVDLTETTLTHTIRDANGQNPYSSTKTYDFDASGNVTLARDAQGNQIEFQRDARGNLVAKKFSENQGSLAAPNLVLQRTINFGYDALGRKTSESVTLDSGETITTSQTWDNGWLASTETVSSLAPAKLFRTEYTFYRDGQGIPTNIHEIRRRKDDGSFQTTSFDYDAKNRQADTVLPDGQKIVSLYEGGSLYVTKRYYEVNSAESPYGEQRYGYDIQGNINQVWDADNNLTQYAHDDLGRLTQITNALNEQTLYSYIGTRLTQVEVGHTTADGEGQVSRMNYTPEGWLASLEEKDDADAWQTVLTNTYDSAGNRLTTSDAQNRTMSYQYDLLGRMVSATDPLSKTTGYSYDMFNNRVSVMDANGNETRTVYDDADRAIEIEQLGTTPPTATMFTYDAAGNLLTVTDAANHTTTFTVDSLSRVTAITQPLGQIVQKFYDSRDRLDYQVNARGNKIDYSYAPWGSLDSISYYAGVSSPTPDRTVSYSYDNALNLISVADDSIQAGPLYTYTYDAMNRLDVTTIAYIPGGNRTQNYDYDRYGNIKADTLTDGTPFPVTYSYDKRNRLASAVLPGNRNFAFTYYPSGEVQQTTYPNGVTTSYVYEANGPVQSITVAGTSGAIEQFSYSYDNVGKVTTETDSAGQYDFTYDGLDRLTQAVYPAATGLAIEHYVYDSVGNREDPSDAALYGYDNNNRITRSPGLTYSFDNDGNMTGRSDGAILSYDKDNRMVQFTQGTTVASYKYDPMGRRILKTVNGTSTWFLWDGADLLAEFNDTGTRTKGYAYLPDDHEPVQMQDANGTYYVHGDHLRTPRLVSDDSQQTVWSSVEEAFGKATVNENPDGNANLVILNQRLTGQYFDAESGYHYNSNRYLDPAIGRYLESDPIGLKGGLNAYTFVRNNPVNLTDPEGLAARRSGQKLETIEDYSIVDLAGKLLKDTIKKGHAKAFVAGINGPGSRIAIARQLRSIEGLTSGFGAALTGFNAVVNVARFACNQNVNTGVDLGNSVAAVAGLASGNPYVAVASSAFGTGKALGSAIFSTKVVGVFFLKSIGYSEKVALEAVADTAAQDECGCN
jgi:RHS repeat-associated protein